MNKVEQGVSKQEKGYSRRDFLKMMGVLLGSAALGVSALEMSGCAEESANGAEQASPEARDFVKKYGDRYDDPLATYYSVDAYDSNSGYEKSVVLDDDYVEGFTDKHQQISSIENGKSELGFSMYELSDDEIFDDKTTLKVFNDYAAPQISRYMNLLAKNPSQKATELIDAQFKSCCSEDGYFTADDGGINSLMQLAKQVVGVCGNKTNYNIMPGVVFDLSGKEQGDNSIFYGGNDAAGSMQYKVGNTISVLNTLNAPVKVLSIDVRTYRDDGNFLKDIKTIEGSYFDVTQQPQSGVHDAFHYISIGLGSTGALKLNSKYAH